MLTGNNPEQIGFAIITYYPKWYKGKLRSISQTDKIRGDLALEFIEKSTSLGYQVVVVDGKSSRSFRKSLNQFPIRKIIKRASPKRSPAKRQAFQAASRLPGVKVIIATEAEKISLIDSAFEIAKPILEGEADIVVPKREDKLFKESYPDYMYDSEVEGNKLYDEQLKLQGLRKKDDGELDMFFGPRVFASNPKILTFFTKKYLTQLSSDQHPKEFFDPEEFSNTQYFPIVMAFKKGLKVQSVEIPFFYPKLQKENESVGEKEYFKEKRKAQRLGVLLDLMYLLNYLKKKKNN